MTGNNQIKLIGSCLNECGQNTSYYYSVYYNLNGPDFNYSNVVWSQLNSNLSSNYISG